MLKLADFVKGIMICVLFVGFLSNQVRLDDGSRINDQRIKHGRPDQRTLRLFKVPVGP